MPHGIEHEVASDRRDQPRDRPHRRLGIASGRRSPLGAAARPRKPGARPILRRVRSARCGAGGRGDDRGRRVPASYVSRRSVDGPRAPPAS
jgi:hypothetical protein